MSDPDGIKKLSIPTIEELLDMKFPDQKDVIAKLTEFGFNPGDFTEDYYDDKEGPRVLYMKGTKDERRVTNFQHAIPSEPYTFRNSWVNYLSDLS